MCWAEHRGNYRNSLTHTLDHQPYVDPKLALLIDATQKLVLFIDAAQKTVLLVDAIQI